MTKDIDTLEDFLQTTSFSLDDIDILFPQYIQALAGFCVIILEGDMKHVMRINDDGLYDYFFSYNSVGLYGENIRDFYSDKTISILEAFND